MTEVTFVENVLFVFDFADIGVCLFVCLFVFFMYKQQSSGALLPSTKAEPNRLNLSAALISDGLA